MSELGEVLLVLRADNPRAPDGDLRMYADAWLIYCEASDNVGRLGAVVAHPKTASPITNPYLAVMASQVRVLQGLRRVARTDRLWSTAGAEKPLDLGTIGVQ